MPDFLTALLVSVAAWPGTGPPLSHGPILGDLRADGAALWARVGQAGDVTLEVHRLDGGGEEVHITGNASEEHDLTLRFDLNGLTPATEYEYTMSTTPPVVGRFVTARPKGAPQRITLAIGSCAKEDAQTARCWEVMAALSDGRGPDAVVLIGDTPYIDSTDLETQRRRYREFAAVPAMASLLRSHPIYSTRDDHDFGRNDTDGKLNGKENSRRAFQEYRPNPAFGQDGVGVYCSFRRGPFEVFLLDTRYFAGLDDPAWQGGKGGARSLLGARQREWLHAGLKASNAPFKVLASGMIWNDAVRPGKTDYWGAYPEEREALFRFIGENRIDGVVLVGGDIHRSRVIRHSSRSIAGYDLTEFISSPMHDSVIALADVPHPGLIKDMGEKHTFLLLTGDSTAAGPAVLTARFLNGDGATLFETSVKADALTAR